MQNMNFTAHAGGDAEFRQVSSGGIEIVNVNVALTDGWGDKKRTIWSKLRIMKKSIPEFMRNIRKGDKITVSNAVYLVDDYDGKDGPKQAHYFLAGFGADVEVQAKAQTYAATEEEVKNAADDENLPF